ncbi:zinc ribbon domain-containing protein [Helcobacillus sp. ACRRO]|uniref:FmdB family zinc ribbon protein n=1 Tax=Helcobacillus sp. ACRRO TaxID=2918202 RepID=UPI001EF40950|nr:zinc ribbon domain-containing protein [Helcobacillus sp. ACRRO]MCG7426241.1 zinc ribbon domain-containing protein [Helcobacillus sp. ACRRO]
MPLYEFSCDGGHLTEKLLPISSETRSIACPACDGEATRRISAPAVSTADPTRMKLMDSTQATAHQPQVVSSVPSGLSQRSTPVTRNPQHQKLPRP